ncbi:MAG: hypothetical protein ACLR17_02005 [Enterobacteriaceae bacterium]
MMALGMLLTLTSNVVTFIIGAVIFTGCFFGCHSIGLSWVSKNATHARLGRCYLFFYYMGSSVIGFVTAFPAMGWQGMTGLLLRYWPWGRWLQRICLQRNKSHGSVES